MVQATGSQREGEGRVSENTSGMVLAVMRMRSLLVHLVAALAVLGVTVAAASANSNNGGANIASAPTVPPGQQEFGNTTDGSIGDKWGDWWKLSLVASDKITVDWESGKVTDSCGTYNAASRLDFWPVGTTDFSVNNVQPLVTLPLGENGKAESMFTANRTGTFLMRFEAGCDGSAHPYGGPYDFTAYVRHALVLAVSGQTKALIQRAHRAPLPHRGTVVFAAHLADGTPVSGDVGATLFAYWASKWHPIGKGAAKGGQIVVPYQLPASVHGLIRLSVNVGGANYQGRQIAWRGIRA